MVIESKTQIISCPKSGRTWLKVMYNKAICEEFGFSDKIIFSAEMLEGFPSISWTHEQSDYVNSRISYKDLSVDKSDYKDDNVFMLRRNFKDAIVSGFFETTCRRRAYGGPTQESKKICAASTLGSLKDFIKSDVFGVKKLIRFYEIWHENQSVPAKFEILRYEEMHEDPEKSFRKFLKFLDVSILSEDRKSVV